MRTNVIDNSEVERLSALTLEEQRLALLEAEEEAQRLLRHDKLTAPQETRLAELIDVRDVLSKAIQRADLRAKVASGEYTVITPDGYQGPLSGYRPKNVGTLTKSAGRPWQVRDHRDGDELRGRAVDCLERLGVADAAVERVAAAMEAQSAAPQEANELARRIAVCSDPAYGSAFAKLLIDPVSGHNSLTTRERAAWDAMLEARAALAIGTTATGGAMVPTYLDPTILLTNSGSSNVMRTISRVVTIGEGNVWHGVASEGVTASFDTEASEVSDDSPTLAQPTIPIFQARAFVRGSMEVFDDAVGLQAEIGRMFADAKDRLEETKFSIGNGTTEPQGLWTVLADTTACRVVSTTAATIGAVDLNAVYLALPARYRRAGTWVANPTYTLAVKALGTAVSASYSGDLRDPAASRILDLPVAESDDAPSAQTTTTLDPEIVLGDFSRYVIADRIGASAEFIPHLFGTSTGRPTGERGVFFRWRTGAGVVDTNAFRVLVDKTSA